MIRMTFARALALACLLTANSLPPAQAQSVRDVIGQAVAAQGGADALRALQTLSIKAEALHWEPGQSKAADGEPRFLGVSTLAITWDLANGAASIDWDRDKKYPAIEKARYAEIVTPALGF